MIHVDRTTVRPPAVLVDLEGRGSQETGRAIASLATWSKKQDPSTWTFRFAVSGDQEIKDALTALFHSKCAYCESVYGVTQPMDVEHWRPNAQVESVDAAVRPGYYWLAATWENLLPSRIDCNRRRKQSDVVTGVLRLAGRPPSSRSTRALAARPPAARRAARCHCCWIPAPTSPPTTCASPPKAWSSRGPSAGSRSADHAPRSTCTRSIARCSFLARKEHLRQIKLRVARVRTLARLLEETVPEHVALALEELLFSDLRELARMRKSDQPYALQARS